jgi:hypothetical protein
MRRGGGCPSSEIDHSMQSAKEQRQFDAQGQNSTTNQAIQMALLFISDTHF